MNAIVEEILVRDGVRLLVASCPQGRAVLHGGGRTSRPIAGYLGLRSAHCPCCTEYALVLHPDLV